MSTFLQDVKYALRTLLKSPGFTLVAVLTLALGIGANSAIFTVVNAVLLRPLPYAEPQRLMSVTMVDTKEKGDAGVPFSALDFADFQKQATSFSTLAAISPQWSLTLTGSGDPETIPAYYLSANFLSTLGAQPALGRAFTEADDTRGSQRTVLLSHAVWQQRFSGDRNILGKAVTLDGSPHTVIGVLPAGFRWIDDAQVWLPLAHNSFTQRPRGVRLFTVVGRIREGVTPDQARSEAATIAARLGQQYPDSNKTFSATVAPLAEQFRGKITTLLLVLLGAVAFVLLIACANIANLLLARAASRTREMAIRAALGAGRGRLVRQLLTESVLLSTAAGLAGLLLAWWGVDLLLSLSPAPIPRQNEIALDASVLLFTLLLSMLSGILFGLAPALQASHAALVEALKEGGRGSTSGHRRLRGALVVAEVALSMVVVIGAGLLIKSFVRLSGVDPGFNTRSVVSMGLALAPTKYPDHNARVAFMQRLYERIEALPGVQSAGDITRVPLGGANNPNAVLEVEGTTLPPSERPSIDFRRASRNYFRAMGIPLVEGREFSPADDATAPSVAIINHAAARKFFPGQSAVGRRIRVGPTTPSEGWTTIVGVVGDIRHVGLNVEPRPEMYIHTMQATPSFPGVMVHTAGDPATLLTALRQVVRDLDPDMPTQLSTMADVRYKSMAQPRFNATLLAIFAALAMALAIVGVYGVLAYTVTQRTQEIGVRMALGAQPRDVVRLVVREGMTLVLAGIALGTLAAAGMTRWLREMLFGVTPADPATFATIAALLAATALAACYIPARRAARVDPMVALRYE